MRPCVVVRLCRQAARLIQAASCVYGTAHYREASHIPALNGPEPHAFVNFRSRFGVATQEESQRARDQRIKKSKKRSWRVALYEPHARLPERKSRHYSAWKRLQDEGSSKIKALRAELAALLKEDPSMHAPVVGTAAARV